MLTLLKPRLRFFDRLRPMVFRGWSEPVVPDPLDLKLPRADWREPRKWRRVWDDKAGGWNFIWCCCLNCKDNTCLGVQMPSTIHATFSNSGTCPVLDGLSFALGPGTLSGTCLVWNSAVLNVSTCPFILRFSCCTGNANPIFQYVGSGGVAVCLSTVFSSVTCSPLSAVFTNNNTIPGGNNCTQCTVCAARSQTITVTP